MIAAIKNSTARCVVTLAQQWVNVNGVDLEELAWLARADVQRVRQNWCRILITMIRRKGTRIAMAASKVIAALGINRLLLEKISQRMLKIWQNLQLRSVFTSRKTQMETDNL
jgi:hypothetical protein